MAKPLPLNYFWLHHWLFIRLTNANTAATNNVVKFKIMLDRSIEMVNDDILHRVRYDPQAIAFVVFWPLADAVVLLEL